MPNRAAHNRPSRRRADAIKSRGRVAFGPPGACNGAPLEQQVDICNPGSSNIHQR
jgi:hypothetical protein